LKEIKIEAHAKINLYLDVLSKKEDGYHNIRSIMQSVSLADELVISNDKDLRLTLSGKFKVTSKRNLALKAAKILQVESGGKQGALICLAKNIPIGAGLGGGSADAAATLIGLNQLWQLNLSLKDLQGMGEKVGADVPFCLQGGTCLVEGIGEKVSPLSCDFNAHVVIAKPPFNLSTKKVYSNFDEAQKFHVPTIESMIAVLHDGNVSGVSSLITNVLEREVILQNPLIGKIKEKALQAGAQGALMSGSGSSVFAIARSKKNAFEIADSLRGLCKHILITTTYHSGVNIF